MLERNLGKGGGYTQNSLGRLLDPQSAVNTRLSLDEGSEVSHDGLDQLGALERVSVGQSLEHN